ncbi:MAG TPA: hypothetical protein VFG45_04115 [Candidatus Nitrosocosmicus sp.]|nr:hypothetical protein [Candidatus Nitrosocosmicus sp.]
MKDALMLILLTAFAVSCIFLDNTNEDNLDVFAVTNTSTNHQTSINVE